MEVASIILRTEDVEHSTAFWSDVVGLTVSNQISGYTFLETGPVTIVLSSVDSPLTDESLTEIVFASDDVRRDYQAMVERGVPFEGDLGPPIMSNEGRDLIGASFRDPNGHYGTLTGWVDAE